MYVHSGELGYFESAKQFNHSSKSSRVFSRFQSISVRCTEISQKKFESPKFSVFEYVLGRVRVNPFLHPTQKDL
jgi:hypothetical protein